MPTLYNLRIIGPDKYAVAKFDEDFNVEAVYELTRHGAGFRCSCPAGLRTVKLKPCKHQRMLPFMLGAVNTDRFFDPERGQWHQPMTADLHEITRESEAAEPPTGAVDIGLSREAQIDAAWDRQAEEPPVETSVNGQDLEPQPPTEPPAPVAVAPTVPSPNRPPPSANPIVTRRI